MRILAIIGSPRKKGNSYSLVKRIQEKIEHLGSVDFDYLFLADADLNLCKGCGVCIIKGEDFCPHKDDRELIEEKILSSDGVIFVSPVYAMNMTALMKNLLDRFAYTMHRPRFFNQYTMIASVTGAVGLKETINSIAAIKYSGFNVVQTFGMVAPEALAITEITDDKILKKIDIEAEKFYKILKEKKPIRPSFNNIMQFRMQQGVFNLLREKLPCDYNYFKEKGWLDKKTKFYADNARINPFKDLAVRLLSSNILKNI